MKDNQISIFDKLNCIFNKEPLLKEQFGNDGYMILRFLSMNEGFLNSVNQIQKYHGILGYRLLILLQQMFIYARKAPFLEYIKKEDSVQSSLSDNSKQCLRKLLNISKQRLEEYLSNLYVTDEDIKKLYGIN